MNTMLARASAALLLVLLSPGLAVGRERQASGNCEEVVYSNVRHVPEVDDYVGTEFILNICRSSNLIAGAWNEYEGYHPVTTELRGQRTGRKIRLTGTNSEGRVEFAGEVTSTRLTGRLTWEIGTSRQEKRIALTKTKDPVRPPQ